MSIRVAPVASLALLFVGLAFEPVFLLRGNTSQMALQTRERSPAG